MKLQPHHSRARNSVG